MTDRRHFPRLHANALWRPAGLIGRQRPMVDVSFSGMRIHSDDSVEIGSRLTLDLFVPGEVSIECLARVVRVDALPVNGAAGFDVALEFLDMSLDVWTRLSPHLVQADGAVLETRIDEQDRHEVGAVEQDYREDRLLQTPATASVTGSPDGQRKVREEDRDQEKLLHRAPSSSGAPNSKARNTNGHERKRLNVLFVTPYLPSPPRFGGQRRLHGLISGMAASHDVSVLSLVDTSEDQAESIRETELYCRRVQTVQNPRYSAGGASKRLLQLGSLFSSHSYEWLVHREQAFDEALARALAQDRYDVVNFEFTHMAAYAAKRRKGASGGPAFVLGEHNIEYELVRQMARAGASAVRRAYCALDWRKLQREEMRTWALLDGCTLTSERDREILLGDAPKTSTAVVPNGVDVEFFKAQDPPLVSLPNTLLFFGAIDYYPNHDGLRFFLGEVLPLLESRVPRVKLSIVGRRPPDEILAHRGPDIEVTGAVPDIRPHLQSAAIVIVPLRLGSGTRLKILEAMAMGKAVVSTTLGAEGLDVVPERDLLIADDAKAFAAQICRLLDDPELARRLGAAARRLVVARYSWQASVKRLSNFYDEVLATRALA